jgi:MFS family permease
LGIPLALFIRDKPEQYGYFPDGESLPPVKNKGEGSEIGFKEGFKQRAFLYLNIVELIRHIIISAVVLHVMPSLSSMGVSRSTAGMVAASLPLVSIVGRVGFGWFGDVFDKRHMMAVALGLIGTGLLAFCYVQQGWLLLIFILPFSSGWGGSMVLTRSMLREYFGRDSFGKMLGIIMGLGSIGGIIGPTLAGWVFDTLGSYLVTWLIFCGLSALSIGLILRIKPLIKIDA